MFDHSRDQWEAAGYTVGQHTKSRAVRWSDVDRVVLHYTADRRAMADTAEYLRRMQKSYVDRRGYSLGYSVAVDQHGVSWEIRGVDYMPAANAPLGPVWLFDGSNQYFGQVGGVSTTSVMFNLMDAGGTYVGITYTAAGVPFTWNAARSVYMTFVYEGS